MEASNTKKLGVFKSERLEKGEKRGECGGPEQDMGQLEGSKMSLVSFGDMSPSAEMLKKGFFTPKQGQNWK